MWVAALRMLQLFIQHAAGRHGYESELCCGYYHCVMHTVSVAPLTGAVVKNGCHNRYSFIRERERLDQELVHASTYKVCSHFLMRVLLQYCQS